jgi:acylphosphatase
LTVRRAEILVTGRVQGVGYRFSVIHQASHHGLVGWVRNTQDGHVEIVAEGSPANMEAFVEWCWRGPSGARVDDVSVVWGEPTGEFADFDVRF